MTLQPFTEILVPVASEADARTTGRAIRAQADPEDLVITVAYVVEKAGGAPDKAGVEQREAVGEAAFEAFRDELEGFDVTTDTVYSTDVAEGIFAAAADTNADAIVFVPREQSLLVRLLTGDVALSLVTENDRPVVSLPAVEEREDETADENATEDQE